MVWVYRVITFTLGCGLMLLSLSYRLGEVAPDDYVFSEKSDQENSQLPEAWHKTRTKEWNALAKQALENNELELAKQYAMQALKQEVTNGRSAALLLAIYEKKEDTEAADQLAKLAAQLWPAHSQVHQQLANYWLKRENIEQTLYEWDILLSRHNGYDKQLFPLLANLALAQHSAFNRFFDKPPKWWLRFFRYSSSDQVPNEQGLLSYLYNARLNSEASILEEERKFYLAHLIRKQEWQNAQFAWLGSLDEKEIKLSNYIFDGGFESKRANTGFDWNFSRHKSIRIKTSSTRGMLGNRALNVRINKKQAVNFKHISQRLLLEAGDYELRFRHRIDKMHSEGYMRWRIRCLNDSTIILGESKPLDKRSNWKQELIKFSVPEDCNAQLLRLEAALPYKHTHYFDAGLWFDDFKITKVEPPLADQL